MDYREFEEFVNRQRQEMEQQVLLMTEELSHFQQRYRGNRNSPNRSGPPSLDGPYGYHEPDVDTEVKVMETASSSARNTNSSSTSASDLSRLADLIAAKDVNWSHLPTIEPDIFKGDYIQYPIWIKSFESLIETPIKSNTKRLFYLSRYTAGDAKDAIQGLLALKSDDAYNQAKEILQERYGNPFLVADAYRKRIAEWPSIKPGDAVQLRKFADFLTHTLAAMESISYLRVLNDPEENRKMLRKLPRFITTRWSRLVDKRMYTENGKTKEECDYPHFKDFCQFLNAEARIACNPVTARIAEEGQTAQSRDKRNNSSHSKDGRSSFSKARTFATTLNSEPEPQAPATPKTPKKLVCYLCKDDHRIVTCPQFKAMDLKTRQNTIKDKGLCWGCLIYGHRKADCKRRMTCEVCKKMHPTLLHDFCPSTTNSTPTAPEAAVVHTVQSDTTQPQAQSWTHTLIVPVTLYHEKFPDRKTEIYAILDPQSDTCFVSRDTMNKMGATGHEVQLKLTTMLEEEVVRTNKVTGLRIQDMSKSLDIAMPIMYARDIIPASHNQIPRPETIEKLPHLKDVANKLHPYRKDWDIGALIGMNCPRLMKPRDVVPGEDDDPYAIRTDLGWGVIGNFTDNIKSNEIVHFAYRTKTKEITPAEVNQLFEGEFAELKTGPEMSVQDQRFLNIVKAGIRQQEDSHFEIPLPFKEDDVTLPNNRHMVEKRLRHLRHKLIKDNEYRKDYTNFMNDVISKGYAEKVPDTPDTSTQDKKPIWYIPHHGVYHPKKNKLRVVFDASAEYEGHSLNKHLLQGPDLMNSLTGILTRFRKEPVAVTCDISACFYQVFVPENQRDCLRFLWWEDGQLHKDPIEYRMTRHIFGATSSPACSNFALKETANRYEGKFGKKIADFLRDDLYVDDGITSKKTPKEASHLITGSHGLAAMGGFNLAKYVCNDKTVVAGIPESLRAKNLQSFSLHSTLPTETTLGMQWDVETDTFLFQVDLKQKPLTRRGILSTVSSLFDPLGLVAPVILEGKRIIQELCRDGKGWDDPIPDNVAKRWETWRTQLNDLSKLRIPRCYQSDDCKDQEPKRVELHHFADASLLGGYGQCSYIRLLREDGKINTALVAAKAKVGPSKPVTVPRLELTAAVMSIKMSNFLRKELDYKDIQETFWSDSKVVLGYINNEARRFHVFVANRVQKIRESTSPDQWHHVSTRENPADLASRGVTAENLKDNDLWWKGPPFLSLPVIQPSRDVFQSSPDDPEMKKVKVLATQAKPDEAVDFLSRLECFSSWHRMKRAVAVCLRLVKGLRDGRIKKPRITGDLEDNLKQYKSVDVAEIENAELVIMKMVQAQAFNEEIAQLRKMNLSGEPPQERNSKENKAIGRRSGIYRLDPYVDKAGVLRVGGRIQRADVPKRQKHPMLLPEKGHVVQVLIDHHHRGIAHSGRGMTLNAVLSAGYWLLKARTVITTFLQKCVICRKLRGAPLGQKMANLPEDRLQEVPPFTYSSVDYFGPYLIRQGRSDNKRYGAVFTCLNSRAIHIEVSNSLDTSSFLNAYRRFVCRRGPVRHLRSDQGSNFIGAKNELAAALAEMDNDRVRQELLKDQCDWIVFKMNPPHASHMNGVVERMIRSIRNALSGLLMAHGYQLDDELLRTLMTEAEAIVNSRPLTYVDMEATDSPQPLSPSQLLTLKSDAVLPPPGTFIKNDLYCNRRWRRVQYLANEFWTRWRREVLPIMQERQKWTRPRLNLAKGDVCLLMDDNAARCDWPLAKVLEVYPGEDGFIRKATVRAGNTTFDRPIHKLVLLLKPGTQDDSE